MKQSIEFLKRDRKVNDTFIKKLENAGFEIKYGQYSYWNNQPYVKIGRANVFLVDTAYNGNSSYLVNAYQNQVVEEIIDTLEEQVKFEETADKTVNDFFEKLSR